MRKRFDALAKGLISEKSRGDKTAIELFIAGTRALALQLPIGDIAFMSALNAPA
jgi:hypothetical protein